MGGIYVVFRRAERRGSVIGSAGIHQKGCDAALSDQAPVLSDRPRRSARRGSMSSSHLGAVGGHEAELKTSRCGRRAASGRQNRGMEWLKRCGLTPSHSFLGRNSPK